MKMIKSVLVYALSLGCAAVAWTALAKEIELVNMTEAQSFLITIRQIDNVEPGIVAHFKLGPNPLMRGDWSRVPKAGPRMVNVDANTRIDVVRLGGDKEDLGTLQLIGQGLEEVKQINIGYGDAKAYLTTGEWIKLPWHHPSSNVTVPH